MRKIKYRIFLFFTSVVIFVIFLSLLTPWPSVLVIRSIFAYNSAKTLEALKNKAPLDVITKANIPYDPKNKSLRLDVASPRSENYSISRKTIVWIHGGAWVYGSKENVDYYARILASKGFVVVTVDYSLAPSSHYPVPLQQINKALEFLESNASELTIDMGQVFLAGDSAGAQIAAQLANIISNPDYAKQIGISPAIARNQLAGVVLFCGAYDLATLENASALMNWFIHTVLWSYAGKRDFRNDPGFRMASVAQFVDANFPPAFISAGNNDPLLPQSLEFERVLRERSVTVESLFFPADHVPLLGHEYQFDVSSEAGQKALSQLDQFLHR
ncbi:alpha/beta hydrolase [Ochrobactrum sp. GPK 3]